MKKVFLALFALIVTLSLVFGNVPLNAQSNNSLVQKLVELFQLFQIGVDDASIDDAVAKTKSQLSADAKQVYKQLFNSQIATLKDRGTPEQIVKILQGQKDWVLKKASEMTFGDGNIPFLPVIPRIHRSPYDLMAMVRNNIGAKGYIDLKPTMILDVVDVPSEPYYIYDIESGKFTFGKSPKNAEKILKSQKRSPLTAAEAIALVTHNTDTLSRHFVYATGSRYDSDFVPMLWLSDGRPRLDYGNRPKLVWCYVNVSYVPWGSASCGSR